MRELRKQRPRTEMFWMTWHVSLTDAPHIHGCHKFEGCSDEPKPRVGFPFCRMNRNKQETDRKPDHPSQEHDLSSIFILPFMNISLAVSDVVQSPGWKLGWGDHCGYYTRPGFHGPKSERLWNQEELRYIGHMSGDGVSCISSVIRD